jgi:hypothetical protein
MTGVEQLSDAIAYVRRGTGFGRIAVSVETVCAAAEILAVMMDNPVTVEWCDTHHRPHEFCRLIEAPDCDPRVRAIGPETGRFA